MFIFKTCRDCAIIENRWDSKRGSVHNLSDNIDRLKRRIASDLKFGNEKDKLTALIIRIMINTSERVGNEGSAAEGHFGITQFNSSHIKVAGNRIDLTYVGKSGVEHEKGFSDQTSAEILSELLKYKNKYLFTTSDGFVIKPDRVNRYLDKFDAKSKDIRGFNANRMVLAELSKECNNEDITESKKRVKIFNAVLRKVAKRIGHGAATLRTHYLLPEIEVDFLQNGLICPL